MNIFERIENDPNVSPEFKRAVAGDAQAKQAVALGDILDAIRALPATHFNLECLIASALLFASRSALSDFSNIDAVQDALVIASREVESCFAPDRSKIAAEIAQDWKDEELRERGAD